MYVFCTRVVSVIHMLWCIYYFLCVKVSKASCCHDGFICIPFWQALTSPLTTSLYGRSEEQRLLVSAAIATLEELFFNCFLFLAALGTGWRMALAPAAAKAQLCWLEFVDYSSLILQGKWLSNLLTTSQRNKFITRSIFSSLKTSHFTGSR